MNKPTAKQEVRFLTQLQRLLSEGQFVATYKYALLVALADIAVERGNDTVDPLTITTDEIADKIIRYYWRQCSPYPGHTLSVFRQNSGKQAGILRLVRETKTRFQDSLAEASRHPVEWNRLTKRVATIVRVMPLWKLQTVGAERLDFLYDNLGSGTTVTLKPGVASCLRKFHGLVRELVQGAWVRYVRRFNPDVLEDAADLEEFMFGSERADLSAVVPVLSEVQKNRCFYCDREMQKGSLHVDHFIPWSRYPVDLGHNFVLAHAACNSSKSDRLAAAEHLAKWSEEIGQHAPALKARFDQRRVVNDLDTSLLVTRWAYQQTFDAGGLTWLKGNRLESLPFAWDEPLSRLSRH